MSRRNQTHRRRTYGRRQHEVRERQLDSRPGAAWLTDTETDYDGDWKSADGHDDRGGYETFGSFGR